jgi:CheY-like chemotaxis protein
MTVLLRLYGHDEVQAARDGVEAVLAAWKNPPDVVLLDIGLPREDGWHVARRLRDKLAGKPAFVVAVSG